MNRFKLRNLLLALMVLLSLPASAYTLAIVNATPFEINCSVLYMACKNDEQIVIPPWKEKVLQSGGCLCQEFNAFIWNNKEYGASNVSNQQMLTQLGNRLGAAHICTVNELAGSGHVRDALHFEKVIRPLGSDHKYIKQAGQGFRGEVIADASDPDGTQVLDQVLLDPRINLKNYQIFRNEILGRDPTAVVPGRLNGSKLPKEAISDHGGLKVTLGM